MIPKTTQISKDELERPKVDAEIWLQDTKGPCVHRGNTIAAARKGGWLIAKGLYQNIPEGTSDFVRVLGSSIRNGACISLRQPVFSFPIPALCVCVTFGGLP